MTEETTLSIDADKLTDSHYAWARAEKDAASDAGERRQAIGELAKDMGIENKALSQFRAGMKIQNEGKRRDWLKSMQALLPIAEQEINGNQPDMFSPPETDAVVPFNPDDESVAAE